MIVMRHRATARVLTALALVAAFLTWSAPASADVPGFAVNLGQAPATFTIGKAARTMTAVVSTDRGRRCVKVRWSLVIRTEGISLDQVRVNRIENGQSFPVRAQLTDDEARVVDNQPDPGQLCRNQTVTGRWDVGFTGPDDGKVTLEARASEGGRLLSSAELTSRVVTAVAAKPSATPSAPASPTATAPPAEEATEAVADDRTAPSEEPTTAALNPAAGTPSVLGPGLIIGAVLVFLGVALLLRIRTRNRRDPAWQAETQALPTGFNTMPRRRRR